MKYIEAPNIERFGIFTSSVFLAGGITNCPDWQSQMVNMFSNTDLVVYNPRRKNFPIDDPKAAESQITWEYYHMLEARYISFWFPCETLCPIVLYELGVWSKQDKIIFVGMHPEYQRRRDVEIQLKLARPSVIIVYSLSDLANQIKEQHLLYEDE